MQINAYLTLTGTLDAIIGYNRVSTYAINTYQLTSPLSDEKKYKIFKRAL